MVSQRSKVLRTFLWIVSSGHEGLGLNPNYVTYLPGDSPVARLVKKLPAVQNTQVKFLGHEDPLEKEIATHSSILAWRTPWTEEPGGLPTVHGVARIRHDLVIKSPCHLLSL